MIEQVACRHCCRVEEVVQAPVMEWVCKTCGVRNFLPPGVGVPLLKELKAKPNLGLLFEDIEVSE